ncbi:MAG: hypothetical protein QOI25_981, partial [Mycobacterium sp.]|nr:hypothetical protein [Mycobacterium sp.]
LLGGGGGEPPLRRCPRHRARHDGSRAAAEAVPAYRGRDPHREVPHPADFDGGPSRDRSDRGGRGLHQQMGCPALGETLAAADFRPGHPASRRGGRDWQTWPRHGDQATAGRTRNGQRPLRALHRSGRIAHLATCVGTAVPAHRQAHHGACRSTGEHRPPAANTVRAAPEQNSLLLTHEERFASRRPAVWGDTPDFRLRGRSAGKSPHCAPLP